MGTYRCWFRAAIPETASSGGGFVCSYFSGSFGNYSFFSIGTFGRRWRGPRGRHFVNPGVSRGTPTGGEGSFAGMWTRIVRWAGCGLARWGRAAVAHFEEAAVRAVILALVTRIVTVDQIESAGIVTESAEGEGRAGGVVGMLDVGRNRVRDFGLPADFVVHAGFFHAPDAHLTPAGDGHVVDERFLERGLGLEFLVQGGDELVKAIRGLALENDCAGEHAMLEGVAGGGELAFLSDGAAGFGAVGAGCLLLTFSTHANTRAREKGDGGELGEGFVDSRGNISSAEL